MLALNQFDDAATAPGNNLAARNAAIEQQMRFADRITSPENRLVGVSFDHAAGTAQFVEDCQRQASKQLGTGQQLALGAMGDIKSCVQSKGVIQKCEG